MRKFLLKFGKAIFLILGLLFLIIAYFNFIGTKRFLDNSIATTGVVTDIVLNRGGGKLNYKTIIAFEDMKGERIEFIPSVSSTKAKYYRGQKVFLVYDPALPHNAELYNYFYLWFATAFFGFFGSLSFFGALYAFAKKGSNKKLNESLKLNGKRIKTDFQGIERGGMTVNGKSPYQIIVQWHDPSTSKVYEFKSENLWYDPVYYIKKEEKIDVLIDPNNIKKYHVDISFLPELA